MNIDANPIWSVETMDGVPEPEEQFADLNCNDFASTVIVNRDLIVEHKYSYFHHDVEDVQQDVQSFIDKSN